MDRSLQLECTDAVNALYNFKFIQADVQFRWLKFKYPSHPLPYFLLGLSEWWKIQPDMDNTFYDESFMAYMDTTIMKAESLKRKDSKNVEASFFLAAAHGFQGRLHSERKHWRKATFSGKAALDNLQFSKGNDTLSPEFLFGDALYNYYSIWIPENYKFLRPIMAFFPKGEKQLGLKQLKEVALNAFYTRTEAQLFLAKIYANEENDPWKAFPFAEYLATTFPDNAYFQRFYARMCYYHGKYDETKRVSLDILKKIEQKYPGYEATSGRYAAFFLAYVYRYGQRDKKLAKDYFLQALSFCDQNKAYESGYYFYSLQNLMQIEDEDKNAEAAKNYAEKLKDAAPKDHVCYKAADAFLKKNYPKKRKFLFFEY